MTTSSRTLMEALDTLDRAERGFVSEDAAGLDYTSYRLGVFDEVEADLESVASGGSPREQVVAHRVLADLSATRGRAAARAARLESAALGGRTGVVLSYLEALDRAWARGQRFEGTGERVIEQLNEEVRELRAQAEGLDAEAADHRRRVAQLTDERDQWRSRADEAFAQVSAMRDNAFVAQGDDRFDLETEADQAELTAQAHASEAEKIEAALEVAEAGVALATARKEAIERLVGDLQTQVERVQAGDADRAEARVEAQAAMTEAADAMADAFEDVMSVHAEAVTARLDRAREHLAQAIAQLEQVENTITDADTGTSVLWELVDAYGEQLRIVVEQAAAVGRLGQVTRVIAERTEAVAPDEAGRYRDAFERLSEQQDELFAEADRIEVALSERIEELDGRGGQYADLAEVQRDRVAAQISRLSARALQ